MKNKKYGIFLVRKNSSEIEGITTSFYSINLNKKYVTTYTSVKDLDENMKKIKKHFPKLLKKGAKIIPVRLTRTSFPIPIKITSSLDRKDCSFKFVDKVERRKMKLKKLN